MSTGTEMIAFCKVNKNTNDYFWTDQELEYNEFSNWNNTDWSCIVWCWREVSVVSSEPCVVNILCWVLFS